MSFNGRDMVMDFRILPKHIRMTTPDEELDLEVHMSFARGWLDIKLPHLRARFVDGERIWYCDEPDKE